MRRETFHEALAATARIACVASLVSLTGCRTEPGNSPVPTGGEPPPITPPESEPTPVQATVDPAALPTDGSKPSAEALPAC
ncbi:MAG: hypothetical protein HC927_05435, partial [Deltaproteobacteria bacterium]|nr:hypothetical protein [Deltaproteobacteria bacterium]